MGDLLNVKCEYMLVSEINTQGTAVMSFLLKPFNAFAAALRACNDRAIEHRIKAKAHFFTHTRMLDNFRFTEAACHYNNAFTENSAARRATSWDNVVVEWWRAMVE